MKLFEALFVLSLFPFDISVGVEAFVIGLSQISFFLSLQKIVTCKHFGSGFDKRWVCGIAEPYKRTNAAELLV